MWILPTQAAISVVVTFGAVQDDFPRSIYSYSEQFPRGLNANVPRRSMPATDVERWAKLLDASDAQFRFMKIMYEQFVQEHNEYLDREAPIYFMLGAELSELHDYKRPPSPEFLARAEDRDRASTRIRQDLIAIEHRFIASFESALTEEQLPRTEILRMEATRRGCRTYFSRSRWADIELRRVWEDAALTYASQDERERVEMILAEYERQLTPLICQRSDMVFEVRRGLTARQLAVEAGDISHAEAANRYRQIMERRLNASTRIRSLNEATVGRIVHVLSDEVASVFASSAWQAAFPELYPDHTALHGLFALMIADEDFDDDEADRVASLFPEYSRRYDALCHQLETICIEQGDKSEAGISGYESQFLASALSPLLTDRKELSIQWFDLLIEQFGDDVLVRYAANVPIALRAKLPEGRHAPKDTSEPILRDRR